MLNGMTVLRFENMPELARSGGKKTAQCTHCAVVATRNMKGAIQWWADTSAMVGLSEGSVASKQDKSWRKPGENWAGKGEVTPENNVRCII